MQNYRRCGRPNCFCADKQHPGHGPYWLLTRTIQGKTRSQSIPASQVKAPQAQIAECRRLRRLVTELIDVSDDLCRSRLKKGTSARKACAQEFAPALEAEIDRFVAPGAADGIDLAAFELHVRRQALRLAARAVERRLNADLSGGGQRPRECRSCGRQGRYAGRSPKTFDTVLGPLALKRAYNHCRACGAGFCPRDASLSPAVTRMTGSAAALASFRRASELLAEVGGVTVRAKRVERVAEALGREITAAESGAAFECEPPAAPTMYLGIDGTGVPMRPKEVADGSASTCEAKLIVIWTAEQRDEDGCVACDTGSTTCSAAIDSAASHDSDPEQSAFARRVWREAERRSFPQAPRRLILGEDTKWIWRVACELFPGAIQIVDFYHAAERLWGLPRTGCTTIGQPPRRGRRRVARNSGKGAWTRCWQR